MAGDKKVRGRASSAQSEHARLELETVLRLRPLLKKEKGDQIVLEPRRMQDGRPATVVLHPMLAKQNQQAQSPAMKMLSPETLHLCKDTEYHLDHILPEDTDQEKVYYSLGLPIARESMDFLKFKKSAKGVRRTTSLVICTGVDHSGRTHTCFGGSQGTIPKRRSPDDGLVPRILDSLFSQSKHHVKNRQKLTFAVRMSLVQVTQARTEQPRQEDDSTVQDLLMPSLSKAAASPLRSPSPSRLSSVKSVVARLEKARSSATGGGSSAGARSEARVTFAQDPDTKDFTTNALFKTCRDVTEARQLLSSGLQAGQKLVSRTTKGHVLAVLQPVLLGQDGSTEREGGKIGVLDMAGIEQSSQKKRNTAVRRYKDSVGSSGQNDQALNAVLHCVRSLQHNSIILTGKTPALDIVDGNKDGISIDDNTSEISCVSQEKTDIAKGPTFKIVPYRQHNLTMLLQPFFSARQTTATNLTLLIAAYPGHRDYAEKRILLNDLELFVEASRENEEGPAVTGFEKRPLSPIQFSSDEEGDDSRSMGNRDVHLAPSRANTTIVRDFPFPSAPTTENASSPSMAYSMDEDDEIVPLPPPYAPNTTERHPNEPQGASAPNASMVVDFPGVLIPPSGTTECVRSVEPHPCNMERSFEKDPPRKKPSAPPLAMSDPLKPTTAHNVEKKKSPSITNSPTKALVSGTKYAYSHLQSSAKKGIKMIDKMMTTEDTLTCPPMSRDATPTECSNQNCERGSTYHKTTPKMGTVVAVSSHSAARNTPSRGTAKIRANNASTKQLKKLEKQNEELLYEKRQLESKCRNLSEENDALKRALAESRKTRWTKEDDDSWEKSKKSLAAPPLIQSPLHQHLNEVQRTFETNGRWNVAIGKSQFKLQYPSYFRRASELDARDNEGVSLLKSPDPQNTTQREKCSGEKRKNNLNVFQKSLEGVKRRKSSLFSSVREKSPRR